MKRILLVIMAGVLIFCGMALSESINRRMIPGAEYFNPVGRWFQSVCAR